MTREQLVAGMTILEAATGKEFTDQQVDVWFRLLGDLEASAYTVAVERAILEMEIPGLPAIGRIRRLATEAARGIPDTAEAVFERVRAAIVHHGYCDPRGAENALGPAIWSVVQGIGGWGRICDSPIEQRATLFAQFRDAWNKTAEREALQARLPESSRPRVIDPTAPVHLLANSMSDPVRLLEREKSA